MSKGKLVLVVSILASFVAFLDGSVINVALPAISNSLGGGLSLQQWVVNAYLLTLGSLILIAGSLSDLFGRKKILAYGLVGFGVASLLCAIAPNGTILIISRALQGAAGALLVPSSLALIISYFKGADQGKAIGTWTAWTGVAFVIGPLVGGALVDFGSWRYIFAINILPIAITLFLLSKLNIDEKLPKKPTIDYLGAVLCVVILAGPVYALIEQPHFGWSDPRVALPMILGLLALIAFIRVEQSAKQPFLPLSLFSIRNFLYGNYATVSIYGGLSVGTFILVIFLQQVVGYSATQAGLSLMPITLVMFALSPRFGALSGKYGPRLFMTVGPLIISLGSLLFLTIDENPSYLLNVLPGVLLFGLGLSVTVAPLTTAILGSIDSANAGIASAVNNAVSRIAGLIAIAVIGVVIGSELTVEGFHRAILVMAVLIASGGLISFFGISNSRVKATD